MNSSFFPVVLGLGLAAASAACAQLPAIPSAREPATNIYHGTAVVDDYQWLEDAANPAVRDWTRQQNERTRAYFDKLEFHDGLEQELSELIADASAIYSLDDCRGGIIFATRFKPPAQQPVLVRLKSVFPPALRKAVFDPNLWNTNGTTAMDWSAPSTDGRLMAICLSENGSENGVLHFFQTDTGRALPDIIPGVECRRNRHFLHTLSATRRAAGRRPAFLPANLVPQTRRSGQRRHL
jgi:prolyl oligopeptidase